MVTLFLALVLDLMSMSAYVVLVAVASLFFFHIFYVFFFVGNDVDFLTLHCRLRRSINNVNNIEGFAVKCFPRSSLRSGRRSPVATSSELIVGTCLWALRGIFSI